MNDATDPSEEEPPVEPVPKWFRFLRRVLFLVFAVGCVVCGVLRACGFDSIDAQVLYFFGTAGLILVLERVSEFSLSKDGVSAKLAGIEKDVKQAKEVARANRKLLTGDAGFKKPMDRSAAAALAAVRVAESVEADANEVAELPGPTVPIDPQKGRFGGQAEARGRRLTAHPTKVSSGGLCHLTLKVEALPGHPPLTGPVVFYLHNSFRNQVQTVTADAGIATLSLWAYGAFTVGALADGGRTKLELDLEHEPQFPKWFRER